MGYRVETDPFMKYDALASEEDLEALFQVLSSVKDHRGNPARLTANCVMGNPDFDRIRESGFREYHFERFTETMKRYPKHSGSFELWKQGMEAGIFHPQYHGREHVNVPHWMDDLEAGNSLVRQAFDLNMLSISSEPVEKPITYMESMEYRTDQQKDIIAASLLEGMEVFTEIFGWVPESFIGTCYTWSSDHSRMLGEKGIRYLQGIPLQRQPRTGGKRQRYRHTFHYTGQKNRAGQRYLVRNAYYEPSIDPVKYDMASCMHRLKIAFDWKRPAIIGSHRLNYIGFIDEENRKLNLEGLERLLKEMLRRWPDIEFVSSDQLGQILSKREVNNAHGS